MDKALQEPIDQLWQEYYFLTNEMVKMLNRQDMELFEELLEQRERLQTLIDKAKGKEFATTTAGKKLLKEIAQQETIITNQLRQLLNHSHKQHNVAQSYDQLNTMAQPRYMDRKG